MKKKSCVSMLALASVAVLAACASKSNNYEMGVGMATPTVDYVESLDVYAAPHKDSFLNQLAMNYRSYAIYNARTSGYSEMGELFAQKAVAAFSGELPFPESTENWPVEDEKEAFDLQNAYNELMEQLKNDASDVNPELAAEAQAKFDCWLSAAASGQTATAAECRNRYEKTMTALRDCRGGKIVKKTQNASDEVVSVTETQTSQIYQFTSDDGVAYTQNVSSGVGAGGSVGGVKTYYPETRSMRSMRSASAPREGVIIVNNVNVPEHLIKPEPVQPLVFNQNIYGGDKTVTNSGNKKCIKWSGAKCVKPLVVAENKVAETPKQNAEIPMVGDELVTREEFINMMMAMRAELIAINEKLDKIQTAVGEKMMIKVQQIPLEPKQHVMEEVFEIRFDFNKATIKPEYQELIRKLASATQENKNIKVSVVGHTDTMGTSNYNYALGGRRAEAVQKMLISYGIPASQIVAVSAGEEDLAVPTPDNTPNAENRRVRVVKEVHYTEEVPATAPIEVEVQEFSGSSCGQYGCNQ